MQVWDGQPQLQQLMSLTADAGAAGTGAAGAAHAPQRVAPRHAFTGGGAALDWSPVWRGGWRRAITSAHSRLGAGRGWQVGGG